jgi:hypothetical protein
VKRPTQKQIEAAHRIRLLSRSVQIAGATDAPRFPDMMPSLMLSYATPAERAEWEATGRPKIDRATIEAAIARRTRWWYERKTATG